MKCNKQHLKSRENKNDLELCNKQQVKEIQRWAKYPAASILGTSISFITHYTIYVGDN